MNRLLFILHSFKVINTQTVRHAWDGRAMESTGLSVRLRGRASTWVRTEVVACMCMCMCVPVYHCLHVFNAIQCLLKINDCCTAVCISWSYRLILGFFFPIQGKTIMICQQHVQYRLHQLLQILQRRGEVSTLTLCPMAL